MMGCSVHETKSRFNRPKAHVEAVIDEISNEERCGLPIKESKVQIATEGEPIKTLGVMMCLEGLYFTEESRHKLMAKIVKVAIEPKTQVQEALHSLMMECVWKGMIHVFIRPFLWRGFRLASLKTKRGVVALNDDFKQDMRKVCEGLSEQFTLPLFPKVKIPGPLEAGALVILMDASSKVGFGAVLLNQPGFFIYGLWTEKEKEQLVINELEAVVSCFSIQSLAKITGGRVITEVVYEYIDNEVAKCVHATGKSHSKKGRPYMARITAKRNEAVREVGITNKQMRVTTEENKLSDSLSRGDIASFRIWAAECGLCPIEVKLHPSIRETSWLLE